MRNILLMFCQIQSVSFGFFLLGIYHVLMLCSRARVCVCLNTKMCSFEWEKFEERLHPKNDDIKAKQKPCCSFRTAFHLYCFPTVYGSMGVCMCLVNGKLNRESFHHSMCRAMPFAKVEQFLFGFLLHACETNNRIVKWSKLCARVSAPWMNEWKRDGGERGSTNVWMLRMPLENGAAVGDKQNTLQI